MSLVDLIEKYDNHTLVYGEDSLSENLSFVDIFDKEAKCFVFMKPKNDNFKSIERVCKQCENSKNNNVILWNPTSSLFSKIDEEFIVHSTEKDKKISKKDITKKVSSRLNKTKIKVDDGAIDCFSDMMSSLDYSYEVSSDLIELRYRSLLLRCIGKGSISLNDVYESIGDDIVSDDNSLFVLYSKGKLDLFFYLLNDKILNSLPYERNILLLKIMNYFEHEIRLKLMTSSILGCGADRTVVVDKICNMKKIKTGKGTYSRNQVKYFADVISSGNTELIKKDSQFKLLAINSCRKTLRSTINDSFKKTYAIFAIMYIVDKISFKDFYSVISRLK
tara:strand:+ start:23085 stop:24083 length:999 start_codon:yes stop_codon:yes gene_type:complete